MAKKIRQWESSRREISKTLSKYMKEYVRNNGGSVTTLKKENSRIAQGANFKGNASPRGTLQNSIRGGSAPKCNHFSFCIPLKITKWQISLSLSILWNPYPFINLKPEKGTRTFGWSLSLYFYRESPTKPQYLKAKRKDVWRVSQEYVTEHVTAREKPGNLQQAAQRTRWSALERSRGEHVTKRVVTHEDWKHREHYHETRADEKNVKWIPELSQLTR